MKRFKGRTLTDKSMKERMNQKKRQGIPVEEIQLPDSRVLVLQDEIKSKGRVLILIQTMCGIFDLIINQNFKNEISPSFLYFSERKKKQKKRKD